MVWRLANFDKIWVIGNWINQRSSFGIVDNNPNANKRWRTFLKSGDEKDFPFKSSAPHFRFDPDSEDMPYRLILTEDRFVRAIESSHPNQKARTYFPQPTSEDFRAIADYAVGNLPLLAEQLAWTSQDLEQEISEFARPYIRNQCFTRTDWTSLQKYVIDVFNSHYAIALGRQDGLPPKEVQKLSKLTKSLRR